MSDYTPSAEELVLAAVNIPENEARRGIAKIKADALRAAAMKLRDGIGSCNTGCHVSDVMTLQTLAARIEEDS